MNTSKQLGTITIDRDLFIELLDALKEQCDKDYRHAEAMGRSHEGGLCFYDNLTIIKSLKKLLNSAFNQDPDHGDIDYFYNEMDFGRDERMYYINPDGSKTFFKDAGELYDYICKPVVVSKTTTE